MVKNKDYSISAIVPLWNEIDLIPKALERIERFLSSSFSEYEMIIVESGSTDGSAKVCDRFAAGKQLVSVFHEQTPRGMGSALKLGFGKASKDLVWAVYVDGSYPLDIALQTLPLFENYDCVYGVRSSDTRGFFRRVQSAIYNQFAKWLLGLHVRHVNSEFKMYKRSVIQSIELETNGWLVDAEIIYKLQAIGMKHSEIDVPVNERTEGKSTVNFWTPFHVARELIVFAWSKRFGRFV